MAAAPKRRATKSAPRKAGGAKKTASKSSAKKAKPAGREKASTARQKQRAAGKARVKKPKPSEGIAAEAIRIVEQAASILEEEIAAGIVAARKVEERYLNVNALRSGDSEQVMQRFRKDAHEVLDIVLDLVNLSINAMTGLGERAMNIRSVADNVANSGQQHENVAELVLPKVLKPGASGSVGMLVENDSDEAIGAFTFSTAGLLGACGTLIEPANITFEPSPLEIAARDVEKVTITVTIPEDAPADEYFGIILAPTLNMRAMLTVRVQE